MISSSLRSRFSSIFNAQTKPVLFYLGRTGGTAREILGRICLSRVTLFCGSRSLTRLPVFCPAGFCLGTRVLCLGTRVLWGSGPPVCSFTIFTSLNIGYCCFVLEKVVFEFFEVFRPFRERTFGGFVCRGWFEIESFLIVYALVGIKHAALAHPRCSPGWRVLHEIFITGLRRITDSALASFRGIMERTFDHLAIGDFRLERSLESGVVRSGVVGGGWNARIMKFVWLHLTRIFEVGRGIVSRFGWVQNVRA